MKLLWVVSGILLVGGYAQAAEQIELVAAKDNTLYEHSSGRLGNGAGAFLFAGVTGQESRGLRRLLLSFDLTSVPANATITRAQLSLTMSKTRDDEPGNFHLHRLVADWSEGTTDASIINVAEGQGDFAEDGDATWIHRTKPESLWQSPGGDFVEQASASLRVGAEGEYVWGMDGELVRDVQHWLDDPAQNFGWILLGDELAQRTARRFNSRSNESEESRPTLRLDYELADVPFDCNGDGAANAGDLTCACADFAESLDSFLASIGAVSGDVDGDGTVGFADFVKLSANFGGTGTYAEGDLNCDGMVSFGDFIILSTHFGGTAAASVPEPGTTRLGWLLLLIAIHFRRVFTRK